jgi:hypothetical protein
MTRSAIVPALVALLAAACAGPPETISLDVAFYEHPAEVAAFEDARDQWCSKTGWCPTFVTNGAITIERRAGMGSAPGTVRGGHTDFEPNLFSNQGAQLWLNGDALDARPDMVWALAAHELGHASMHLHSPTYGCTMYWKQDEPSYELTCED